MQNLQILRVLKLQLDHNPSPVQWNRSGAAVCNRVYSINEAWGFDIFWPDGI